MTPIWLFATVVQSGTPAPELEAKVAALFEDCTMCHDDSGDPSDPAGFNMDQPPSAFVKLKSAATGRAMVSPGDPDGSYLLDKLLGKPGIEGEIMPEGDDPFTAEQLTLVRDWIAALPKDDSGGGTDPAAGGASTEGTGEASAGGGTAPKDTPIVAPPRRAKKPFHGTHQSVLPTTTALGRNVLQYRIDHRFGRIGSERGAFGTDVGANISFGLAYGILDGWDVQLRRTNTRKGWELGTKYIPLRQEDGRKISFGGYASFEYFRDFDVANAAVGNLQLMLSRLWFDRWSTMLLVGYHMRTNHAANPQVDLGNGNGPEAVRDKRDTVTYGLASSVWLGKKKRWGIDLEYFIPVPDGGSPNKLFYRGGDADPSGSKIGSWSLGGSYKVGLHYFQVVATNNRFIHTNLAAPGGQSGNPFGFDAGTGNPLHKADFFLGFNLARQFKF